MSGDRLEVTAKAQLGQTELDVSVRVEAGRCLALAGPSGAGKTSVLRAVAGLLRPQEGVVRCGDEVWLDTATGVSRAPDRRRVGYLFQNYALFPHLRGWQNVAYPLRGQKRKERRAHAVELLERFGVGHLADVRPGTYSGGESQRVALARTLARDPMVLLLDEPLSALDARTRASAGRTLKTTLGESDVPTLVVTHDFNEAALLGDEIAIIDHGRILQHGTASALAAAPASTFVADFTGAVVLAGVASPGPDGLTAVDIGDGLTVFSTAHGVGRRGRQRLPLGDRAPPRRRPRDRVGAEPAGGPSGVEHDDRQPAAGDRRRRPAGHGRGHRPRRTGRRPGRREADRADLESFLYQADRALIGLLDVRCGRN